MLRPSRALALMGVVLLVPIHVGATDPSGQPPASSQPNAIASAPGASSELRKFPNTHDYYPPKARSKGITGRVGLEYSVDARGRAQNIVIVESGGPLLDAGAKKLAADGNYTIPANWAAIGGPARRLRMGMIFQLVGKPRVAPFEDNRPTVVVTGVPYRW
jgi:TonB family protein